MTKKLFIAAAFAVSAICISAADVQASASPSVFNPTFDCGDISATQVTELEAKATSQGLRDFAKQCDEQAEEYELKATDALQANSGADVSFLREKAANAYMNVAVFTNSSYFKN